MRKMEQCSEDQQKNMLVIKKGPSGENLKGLAVLQGPLIFLLTIKVFCAKLIIAGCLTGFWFT
jgi:hypothetical protein